MKYYKRIDATGKTTTVESYSHDKPVAGAVEIDQKEYDTFMAALPTPAPALNIREELSKIKADITAINAKLPK